MTTEFNGISLTTESNSELSSQEDWQMNEFNDTNILNIDQASRYIAEGTRKIVDAMKEINQFEDGNFEKEVQQLLEESKIKQEKELQEFNDEHRKIRESFRKRK